MSFSSKKIHISLCPWRSSLYAALNHDWVVAPTCSPVKFWMKVRLVELIIATLNKQTVCQIQYGMTYNTRLCPCSTPGANMAKQSDK